MGTNYVKRLRDRGLYDPAKWRAEREGRELDALKRAWAGASWDAKAMFMASVGLFDRPDPDAVEPDTELDDLLANQAAELLNAGTASAGN